MDILKESRGVEYFTNLHALTGLSSDRWTEVIVKELLDNALDAVDHLNEKRIAITCNDLLFCICDNAGGIPESALDDIYNFNLYVSSKRHTRTVSRGAQGNALKTIIAICFKLVLNLFFVTNGKKITYTPNATLIGLGHLDGAFNKSVETTDSPPGVYIEMGIDLGVLWEYLFAYHHVNPDMSLFVNGEKYQTITETKKFPALHSIHWYDPPAFSDLLKRTALNFPEKTTKQFISQFSKTQRIMGQVELPGKLLSDFYTDDSASTMLLEKLKTATEKFRPQVLEKYAMGKSTAEQIHGSNFISYRKTVGEYENAGASIPYLIEMVLCKDAQEEDAEDTCYGTVWEPERNSVITCVNNSVNYANMPFRFNHAPIELAGVKFYGGGLRDILHESGFMSGSGHTLFIHFVSPYIEFYDKAKSIINTDRFKNDLFSTLNPIVTPIIKEVRRLQRNSTPKPEPTRKDKSQSKKSMMFKYFMGGVEIATGDGQYTTTARQVFYAIRKLVINDYGIVLDGRTDFSTLTQVVITTMFERHPELEDRIYFERRGFYLDIETGEEIPMNTQRVNEFSNTLTGRNRCNVDMVPGRYSPAKQTFNYPYELAVSSVLFVEKQGFTEVFKKSGILDELNLGLISSQGFGTRAIKKMIQDFIARGINVYALTDCDLAGQVIGERLIDGSNTFKEKLDIKVIGLTFADVLALDKIDDAEEYTSTKSYVNVLDRMNQAEKDFFLKKKTSGMDGKDLFTYRRVELNALTMPELLDFIRSKIQKRQIRPTRDQIKEMVGIDFEALKHDAVMRYLTGKVDDYMSLLSGVDTNIDLNIMVDEIDRSMSNGRACETWQSIINSVIGQNQKTLTDMLNHQLRIMV